MTLLRCLTLAAVVVSPVMTSGRPAQAATTVFAAASLQEVLTEAAGKWRDQGHALPVLVFAGTGTLAKQIENGAPADIFISADPKWTDALVAKNKLNAAASAELARNRLVAIVPQASKQRSLGAGVKQARRIAIGEPASVPAGNYARQALQSLGLWPIAEPKLVFTENVRAALALASRNEVDVALVYRTDVAASDAVRIVATLPSRSHDPIRYTAAMTTGTRPADARQFMGFLRSREVAAIFRKRGFASAR